MDLSKGQLQIGDYLVTPETIYEEAKNNLKLREGFIPDEYNEPSEKFSPSKILYVEDTIDGQDYRIQVNFYCDILKSIKLVPINLERENPGYPDDDYFNYCAQIIDEKLLSKQLADYTPQVISKERAWGKVYDLEFGQIHLKRLVLQPWGCDTGGEVIFHYNKELVSILRSIQSALSNISPNMGLYINNSNNDDFYYCHIIGTEGVEGYELGIATKNDVLEANYNNLLDEALSEEDRKRVKLVESDTRAITNHFSLWIKKDGTW